MILSIWLCCLWMWLLFLVLFINYIFEKYHFLKQTKRMSSFNLPAFSREDYPKWSKCSFILTGFLLAPIRIAGILKCILLIFIQLKILSWIFCVNDFSKAQSPMFLKLGKLTLRFYCRLILFLFGYWWIPSSKLEPCEENFEGLECLPESSKAVIVCNHVSFIDIFYLLSQDRPVCFVSNALVKDFPLVGMISRIMQCVFVERKSKESRAKCFSDMKSRIKNIAKQPKCKHIWSRVLYNFVRLNDLEFEHKANINE